MLEFHIDRKRYRSTNKKNTNYKHITNKVNLKLT